MLSYDYKECDGSSAQKMMDHLQSLVDSKDLPGKKFKGYSKEFVVSKVDNLSGFISQSILPASISAISLDSCSLVEKKK